MYCKCFKYYFTVLTSCVILSVQQSKPKSIAKIAIKGNHLCSGQDSLPLSSTTVRKSLLSLAESYYECKTLTNPIPSIKPGRAVMMMITNDSNNFSKNIKASHTSDFIF